MKVLQIDADRNGNSTDVSLVLKDYNKNTYKTMKLDVGRTFYDYANEISAIVIKHSIGKIEFDANGLGFGLYDYVHEIFKNTNIEINALRFDGKIK